MFNVVRQYQHSNLLSNSNYHMQLSQHVVNQFFAQSVKESKRLRAVQTVSASDGQCKVGTLLTTTLVTIAIGRISLLCKEVDSHFNRRM
jgi:hypothetical protein